MPLSISQATKDDVQSVAILFDQYRVFYEQQSDIALAQGFVRERIEKSESVIFIAQEDGGDTVGFTQLYPSFSSVSARRTWVLNDLYVTSNARGIGVGKCLLEKAESFARAAGAKGIGLQTAMNNLSAQRLYERLGYQKEIDFFSYYLTL
jgi:ribosomal protein S18 acetylase RimI-like enzyme